MFVLSPSLPSAVTAMSVADNVVVDCTDSGVVPTRTATTQRRPSRCGSGDDGNAERHSRRACYGRGGNFRHKKLLKNGDPLAQTFRKSTIFFRPIDDSRCIPRPYVDVFIR